MATEVPDVGRLRELLATPHTDQSPVPWVYTGFTDCIGDGGDIADASGNDVAKEVYGPDARLIVALRNAAPALLLALAATEERTRLAEPADAAIPEAADLLREWWIGGLTTVRRKQLEARTETWLRRQGALDSAAEGDPR